MAGLYNGHILEFPQIRIDCFTSPPPLTKPQWFLPTPSGQMTPAPNAQLYLLTHVHTDHLLGLSSDFTGKIICSPDTKRMLLKLEAEVDRGFLEKGIKEVGKRKYEGLKRKVVDRGMKSERVVDRIEAVPFGHPREVELGYEDGKPVKASITLLDANHCPGSTMFLITSPKHAILHTGDIRCDHLFMQSLRRHPAVQEFIVPFSESVRDSIKREDRLKESCSGGRRVLDRIYLDTGAILGTGDMPDREPVLQDLINQISLYPSDTVFFLNTWCFGWEDVIKEIARSFNTKIHVDRYKRTIYSAIQSDPYLLTCTTTDENVQTRFHACDRYHKCKACRVFDETSKQPDGSFVRTCNLDKRIVVVNMVEIKSAAYEIERRGFLEALGKAANGERSWPYSIDCPIARHSPLPELQNLVKLFKPLAVSPNTIAHPQGLDYYLLPELFKNCLEAGGYEKIIVERDKWAIEKYGAEAVKQLEVLKSGITIALSHGLGLEDIGMDPRVGMPRISKGYGKEKLGASRKAHLEDQALRSTGLSGISLDRIKDILDRRGKPQLKVSAANRFFEVGEYDTDDEESNRKRRRVVNEPESSDCLSMKVKVEVDSLEPAHKREIKLEVKAEKNDVRLEADSSGLGSGSRRGKIKTETRSTPRFVVDREHLRALAMVAQDESQ